MKKNSLILGLLVCSSFLFGNEFDGYEEHHNFLEPVDMVQTIIDARDDFGALIDYSSNEKLARLNFKALKNVHKVDAHLADNRNMVCTYMSRSKNIISAFFQKHKESWVLKKLTNSKHQQLNKKLKNSYVLDESENCFYSFMDSFEQAYPNSELRLVGRETKVEGIMLKKNNKVFNARFNFSYLSFNQYAKSGWYLSKVELFPSKTKKILNKKVASNKRGFFLKKVVPYLPNARLIPTKDRRGVLLETKPLTNLKELVCSNHEKKRFVRMVFTLDKALHIRKTLWKDTPDHKLIRFNVNAKKMNFNQGNCHFLQVDSELKLGLDLRDFQKKIINVKYGTLKNRKKSYLDLSY